MSEKRRTKLLALLALFSLLSDTALYQTFGNRSLRRQVANIQDGLAAQKTFQTQAQFRLGQLPTETELTALRADHAEAIRLRALAEKLKLDLDARAGEPTELTDKEESRWVGKWNFKLSVRIPKDHALIQVSGKIAPGKQAIAVFDPMIFADTDEIKISSVWFEAPTDVIQNLTLNQIAASPNPDSGYYFLSKTEAEALLQRLLDGVAIKVVRPPGIITSFGREVVYSRPDPITTDSGRQINTGPVMKILAEHSVEDGVELTIEAEWKIEIARKPD